MNSVVVLFKEKTVSEVIQKAMDAVVAQGGSIGQQYTSTVLGFSATVPDHHIKVLLEAEGVDLIEPDGPVSAFAKSLGI